MSTTHEGSGPAMGSVLDLDAPIRDLAAHRPVLIASDMDGVLAPFDDDPLAVRPIPESLAALRDLAAVPGVHVAVVSGRDLATLRLLTGIAEDEPLTLIGSHGAETSADLGSGGLSEEDGQRLAALRVDLERVIAEHPPTRIEYKPASIGLHVRGLPEEVQAAALAAGAEAARRHPGVTVIPGKGVLEAGVLRADKGSALLALAATLSLDAVAYLGDDVTDEHAFEALATLAHPFTVKVGEGPSAAAYRVPDEHAVAEVLTHLAGIIRAS